jgi:hypothetical protein
MKQNSPGGLCFAITTGNLAKRPEDGRTRFQEEDMRRIQLTIHFLNSAMRKNYGCTSYNHQRRGDLRFGDYRRESPVGSGVTPDVLPHHPAYLSVPRRFLFLGPGLCLQLHSDSASRRTPLLFGSGYPLAGGPSQGSVEDFYLQVTRFNTICNKAALHKLSFSRPRSSRGYELQFQKPFRVFMGYLRQIVRADWCDVQHLAAFGVGGEGIVDREQHTVGAEDL